MAETYYLDTSIWIDFYEKRDKNGESALNLILKIIEEDLIIAYSDLIIKEFRGVGYSIEIINSILKIAKPDNLKKVHIYISQIEEANKLGKERDIPKGDALHAILCRDNNLLLISRDQHFEKLKDITKTKLPENVI